MSLPAGAVNNGAKPRRSKLTQKWSIAAVWAAALLVGAATAMSGGAVQQQSGWSVFIIGAVVLLTFLLQLMTAEREGFIVRTALSISGALAILFVINVLFWVQAG
ncbi:hypothetical protein [Canibacter zhoujuaniae]|uniref:hypothetical protein n=1 Tax=Canibacter zhoujuaniae TaxID=2708343 RepID=UPI00141ECAAE|nr:hypothetical protein [Canibacter zhoujuaniae]